MKLGMFADGNYSCWCSECGIGFAGDKRATNCLRCAGKQLQCQLAAEQEKNKRLKGEKPIPFAWWKDCPGLAQKTMERTIERNERLLAINDDLVAKLAAEQEKNRWIPVAERLPEEDGYYLTKYKGDKRQCLDEKTWIRAYPFYGMFKDNWIYKKPTKYSVTHWRPIDLPDEPDGKAVKP